MIWPLFGCDIDVFPAVAIKVCYRCGMVQAEFIHIGAHRSIREFCGFLRTNWLGNHPEQYQVDRGKTGESKVQELKHERDCKIQSIPIWSLVRSESDAHFWLLVEEK